MAVDKYKSQADRAKQRSLIQEKRNSIPSLNKEGQY